MGALTAQTEVLAPVSGGVQTETVGAVLRNLVRDPWHSLVLRWNWKSFIFSSLIRAQIFFWITLRAGWRAAVAAFLTELSYRGLTAGFYGALTQAFRGAQPAWAAGLTVMVLLPLISHSVEYFVHSVRHTQNLAANITGSVMFTAVSTLFNWYAMRNGSLITGAESKTVAQDLKSIPRLIVGFLAAGPVALWRVLRPYLWPEILAPEAWVATPLHESEDAASD